VRSLTAILITLGLACAVSAAQRSAPVIDHVYPKPDSTGAVPARFEWTSIEGAEQYVITLYNDTDVLLFRQYVKGTSVPWPKALQVEEGTYFWMVGALRHDQVIADSGRAAFVVINTR
jgi:hypothetical protein